MAKPMDLELMRNMLADNAVHIALATIKATELVADRSLLRVRVQLLPENLEIIAMMSWEHVGPNAGIFGFPVPNDLVLVAFVDKDPDLAFVIKRLTSKEDKIPLQAVNGDTVIRALAGKRTHLLSDTEILLGRGGATDPTEPLVLGAVFKAAYSQDLQKTAEHRHIGNLGYYTDVPHNFQDFLDLKESPVDDELMLSDIARTEK